MLRLENNEYYDEMLVGSGGSGGSVFWSYPSRHNELAEGHYLQPYNLILIHEADPQSHPVVITIFTHVIRQSVLFHFSKSRKTNNFHVKIEIGTWETPGLAEWTPILYLLQ